jgi:hypothetical protein
MHKFGVFAALTLSWITASCAERMVHPAVMPQPTLPRIALKTQLHNVEVRHRAETIAENTGKRSAVRPPPSGRSKRQREARAVPRTSGSTPTRIATAKGDPNLAGAACSWGTPAAPGTRRADLPLNTASHRLIIATGATHVYPARGISGGRDATASRSCRAEFPSGHVDASTPGTG